MSHLISYFIFFPLILLVWSVYLILNRKKSRINRWQKSLNLEEHARIFHQLYQNAEGFRLSKNARQGHDAIEYAYGEIEFLSFIALLSLIRPNEDTVFYDLGSGIGKAVVACSMVFPVRQCVGIELFPELYFDACKHVERLAAIKNYTEKAKKIKFVLSNFLDANLNDATLIFINSTAFIGPTWEKLCSKLDHLRNLNTVITTSKKLVSNNYIVIRTTKVSMSWGVVYAYIHSRKQT